MGKAMRKPRPAVPDWVWWDRDGCWNCPDRHHCNSCKANKAAVAAEDRKKRKQMRKEVQDYE